MNGALAIASAPRHDARAIQKIEDPDLKPHAGFRLPVCLHKNKIRPRGSLELCKAIDNLVRHRLQDCQSSLSNLTPDPLPPGEGGDDIGGSRPPGGGGFSP